MGLYCDVFISFSGLFLLGFSCSLISVILYGGHCLYLWHGSYLEVYLKKRNWYTLLFNAMVKGKVNDLVWLVCSSVRLFFAIIMVEKRVWCNYKVLFWEKHRFISFEDVGCCDSEDRDRSMCWSFARLILCKCVRRNLYLSVYRYWV
jgi:hypothetical protein